MSADDAPSQGDLIWIDFYPQAGHEQAGRRPAVVLSRYEYNRKVGLALICPITSRRKGYPFEIALPDGLPIHGVVLSDQLKSLDWRARRAERVGRLPDAIVEEILVMFGTIL